MNDDLVRHRGIVSTIRSNTIEVSIVAQSACAGCHAKGFCGVADMKEKMVEVSYSGATTYEKGDFVNVTLKRKLGLKAVLYGYFLPFILLMLTLIGGLSYFQSEGLAALVALGILAPYYFVLYTLKDKLRADFEFQLEKDIPTINFNINTSDK